MQEPASFYYGVMWNKLYRADIVREHPDVRCNEELDYSEDLYFNLSFIRYAQQFYALSTPLQLCAKPRQRRAPPEPL